MSFITRTTLDKLTDAVRKYYHQEGYTGEFGRTAEVIDLGSRLDISAPEYSRFMLYGRNPGLMPPIKPIMNWCERYGISANPWGIAHKIAKRGTSGNNFIEKNMDNFQSIVEDSISSDVNEQIDTYNKEYFD